MSAAPAAQQQQTQGGVNEEEKGYTVAPAYDTTTRLQLAVSGLSGLYSDVIASVLKEVEEHSITPAKIAALGTKIADAHREIDGLVDVLNTNFRSEDVQLERLSELREENESLVHELSDAVTKAGMVFTHAHACISDQWTDLFAICTQNWPGQRSAKTSMSFFAKSSSLHSQHATRVKHEN